MATTTPITSNPVSNVNSTPSTGLLNPTPTTQPIPSPAATAFTQIRAMPVPRSTAAPLFDGRYVNDFLDTLEHHAKVAAVSHSELPKLVAKYCTDEVKAVVRFDPALSSTDWKAAKELLLELYGAEDEPPKVTMETLRAFIRDSARGREFSTRADLDQYHRGYVSIAYQLLHNQVIDATEMKLKFFVGLPKHTKRFVVSKLPPANTSVNNPPALKDVIAIINRKFDPTHIESYSLGFEDADIEEDPFPVAPQASQPITLPMTTINNRDLNGNKTRTNPTQKPVSDIDALAQQLQQLSLNQAQMQQMMQNALSIASNPIRQNRPTNRTCFICGQTETHRMHPRYCPETPKLIAEALIRYDSSLDRYVQLDGSDLPQVPYGTTGGVAQYLRAHKQDSIKRDPPPHLISANASPVTLMLGDHRALQGDVYAIAANQDEDYSYYEYDHQSYGQAHPVTRSGKDTSSRFEPNKRPSPKAPVPGIPTKTKPNSAANPNPHSLPTNPTKAPAPLHRAIDTPKPPLINTREGFKQSLPNPRPSKDVEMKDADQTKRNQYHYTSDLQEQVSVEEIQSHILKTQVTLPLSAIIGLSPALQKKMTESTKTRREYLTRSGEYDFYSPEAEVLLESEFRAEDVQPASRLMVDDTSMLDSFLLKYSNAVHFKPTKNFAMTTGSFTGLLAGHEVKFLVDCGSELNIFPERVLIQTGLALDFDGARWSLKGVNGNPESLKGVCQDVPIEVGGHRFDHHFFVTRSEMESQDCILGQPWLQWFAARVDHQRDGIMSIVLWKDGDRRQHPTIAIQLTKPDDPRNVDSIAPQRAPNRSNQVYTSQLKQSPQIEEVSDEEDGELTHF